VHPIYQVCAEALIGLGRHDDAANLLDELESLANAIQRVPALAGASRARAALLCAAGDYDTAVSLCERSLELQSRLPEPFELARTRLVLGTILRRAQRKAPARRELERAISEFAAIGAHSWEQKAKAELRRIGGRAPSGGLTATEERVALLVARGKSNSEVAAALFVSPKTVEWNLSKIYRKLRVASRTELAARLARDHRPPA
jgi:DNA-binding CsgD family transcriptional regulator